ARDAAHGAGRAAVRARPGGAGPGWLGGAERRDAAEGHGDRGEGRGAIAVFGCQAEAAPRRRPRRPAGARAPPGGRDHGDDVLARRGGRAGAAVHRAEVTREAKGVLAVVSQRSTSRTSEWRYRGGGGSGPVISRAPRRNVTYE